MKFEPGSTVYRKSEHTGVSWELRKILNPIHLHSWSSWLCTRNQMRNEKVEGWSEAQNKIKENAKIKSIQENAQEREREMIFILGMEAERAVDKKALVPAC